MTTLKAKELLARLRCFLFGHRWKAFYQREVCPVEYRRCDSCGWIRHACDEIDWSKAAALRSRSTNA